MRRTLSFALAVAALMLAPALAAAQHNMGAPAHEIGVDLGLAYWHPSGGSGYVTLGSPIDARLGFVMHSGWTLEPRVILQIQSGPAAGHNIDLDVNALFPVGTGSNYRKGMYLTAGGGLDFIGDGTSGTLLQINGGIGTRVPYESGAIRMEAYVKYHFQDTGLLFPNTFELGGRVGLSLWH